jgi:hypothetical protein
MKVRKEDIKFVLCTIYGFFFVIFASLVLYIEDLYLALKNIRIEREKRTKELGWRERAKRELKIFLWSFGSRDLCPLCGTRLEVWGFVSSDDTFWYGDYKIKMEDVYCPNPECDFGEEVKKKDV